MFELVIARYNEDLTWLSKINLKYKIYNKGTSILWPFTQLPNVGREAKTYLHHIVENYSNLSEYTIFLQGNPYDHSRNFDQIIENIPNSLKTMPYFSDGCHVLCHRILCETQEQLLKHHVFPEDFHNVFFKIPCKKFRYGSGAQYIVHKENILNKPFQFYKNMHDKLMWNDHEPWSIERVWPNVFDKTDKYMHKII